MKARRAEPPTNRKRFVLDANAFIQAKRRFYALDFCPGYWRTLVWHRQRGHLTSIDRVRDELERGGDDLWAWARREFGDDGFASTRQAEVAAAYAEIVAWVNAQTQFLDAAKTAFLAVADGWIAAYARVENVVVVTLEEFDPLVRKRAPLPNVCRAFDVESITPFEMLRRLHVKLDWESPT